MFPPYIPPPESADPRETLIVLYRDKPRASNWEIALHIFGFALLVGAVVGFVLAVIFIAWQPLVLSILGFWGGTKCLSIGLRESATTSTERGCRSCTSSTKISNYTNEGDTV